MKEPPPVVAQLELPPPAPASITYLEPHFKIPQIARFWNLCETTVRKLFANEPGVLAFVGDDDERTAIRVPQSVMLRVRERYMIKAAAEQKKRPTVSAGVLARRPQRELRAS